MRSKEYQIGGRARALPLWHWNTDQWQSAQRKFSDRFMVGKCLWISFGSMMKISNFFDSPKVRCFLCSEVLYYTKINTHFQATLVTIPLLLTGILAFLAFQYNCMLITFSFAVTLASYIISNRASSYFHTSARIPFQQAQLFII